MKAAAFHLAWRYTLRHPAQTLTLAAVMSLVFTLPLSLRVLIQTADHILRSRAANTPLVLGALGSNLDLVLSSLYFRPHAPDAFEYGQILQASATGLAKVIPIHNRFHAQNAPIIGTELDYFETRNLRIQRGRWMLRLGDCVVGSRVAAGRDLNPGDHVISSPEQAFNLAGVYPLKMRVTGVLASSDSPDDDAIFVDLKTAWLIEGLAHGHDDVSSTDDGLLSSLPEKLVANASIKLFQEVTDDNLSSFHFHGDDRLFPVTAAIVFPSDLKSEARFLGRYLNERQGLQVVVPSDEIASLIETLFRVEKLATAMVLTIGFGSLGIAALVFVLLFRLRHRPFQTLAELGVRRFDLASVVFIEIAIVVFIALLVTFGWVALTHQFAPMLVRQSF